MKCKICNEIIKDDGKFKYCPYCGNKIEKNQELNNLREVISYLVKEHSFDVLKQSQKMTSYVKDYLYFDERNVKLFKIASDAGVLQYIHALTLDCTKESQIICINKCIKVLEDTCFLSEDNSKYIVNEIFLAIYGDSVLKGESQNRKYRTKNDVSFSSNDKIKLHNDSKKYDTSRGLSEQDINIIIRTDISVNDDILFQIYNYSLCLIDYVDKLGKQHFFKLQNVELSEDVKRRSYKESEEIAFNYLAYASKNGYNQATQALGFCFANGIGVYERDDDIAKQLYNQYRSNLNKNTKDLYKKRIKDPVSESDILKIIEHKNHLDSLILTNKTIKLMYNYGIKLISMTVSNSLNHLIKGPEISIDKYSYVYKRDAEENQKLAIKILVFLANYGDSDSSLIIGDCFRYGYGVDVDYNAAKGYYKQAYIYGNRNGYRKLKNMEA